MKQLNFLRFLAVGMLLIQIPLVCQAKDDNKGPSGIEITVQKNPSPTPGRPLIPSRDRVTFVYDSADGTCTFSCTREFLHMDVDIVSLSGGESYSETITAEYPVMYAPLSHGEYHIRTEFMLKKI